jgi:hypothetical protein
MIGKIFLHCSKKLAEYLHTPNKRKSRHFCLTNPDKHDWNAIFSFRADLLNRLIGCCLFGIARLLTLLMGQSILRLTIPPLGDFSSAIVVMPPFSFLSTAGISGNH